MERGENPTEVFPSFLYKNAPPPTGEASFVSNFSGQPGKGADPRTQRGEQQQPVRGWTRAPSQSSLQIAPNVGDRWALPSHLPRPPFVRGPVRPNAMATKVAPRRLEKGSVQGAAKPVTGGHRPCAGTSNVLSLQSRCLHPHRASWASKTHQRGLKTQMQPRKEELLRNFHVNLQSKGAGNNTSSGARS